MLNKSFDVSSQIKDDNTPSADSIHDEHVTNINN